MIGALSESDSKASRTGSTTLSLATSWSTRFSFVGV
jgi:hypothetical protein